MTAPLPPLLLRGDCLVELRRIPDESVDAVVTDPPYGLDFMGRDWDNAAKLAGGMLGQLATGDEKRGAFAYGGTHSQGYANHDGLAFELWTTGWARECLRILKPGGHLLAFGGSRTWHRLAAGIEDAGLDIRDSIAWLYGSGSPKSMDVAKAIASGTGRPEDIRRMAMGDEYVPSGRGRVNYDHGAASAMNGTTDDVDLPDAAREWEGWGTALKPAFEPVVVARKPLIGTVAANVLEHGTGALNIDATRIVVEDADYARNHSGDRGHAGTRDDGPSTNIHTGGGSAHDGGRWPANVVLDESQAAALDEQSGYSKGRGGRVGLGKGRAENASGIASTGRVASKHDDAGGASRFFYVAKASKSERPIVWLPACNCETIKPCAEPSRRKATDESRSTDEVSSSTSSSGKKRKGGKSRRATTSTIETATSSTTTGATSNSSRSSSTSASIPGASFETANGGSPAASVASSSPSPSSTGTSPPKAGRSTAGVAPATSERSSSVARNCDVCGVAYVANLHPTVKPLALMRWLLRLVTPPGGCIVDPFAGSGTTLEAAYLEGFESIGVEMTPEYWPLIAARIERVTR